MGQESECTVRVGRKRSQGRAWLENESLSFRGGADSASPLRLDIRFDQIHEVLVEGGSLVVRTDEGETRFELTEPVATRWMRLIKEPKGLFEKLELGPESKPVAIDVTDPVLLTLLRERTAGVVEGRVPEQASLVFFGAETREALRKLSVVRGRMIDTGTLWIIRPKQKKAIAEADVFEALREAGLVDTKVVAVSSTHTAHKAVVPLELRGPGKRRRPPIVSIPPGSSTKPT
jgi:hypothetical protein